MAEVVVVDKASPLLHIHSTKQCYKKYPLESNSVAILRDAESANHFLNNLEHSQGVKIPIKG